MKPRETPSSFYLRHTSGVARGRARARVRCLVAFLWLAACGGAGGPTPGQDGAVADAGVGADAGNTGDAGFSVDAGIAGDGGLRADAGLAADAGSQADGGAAADAGVTRDAGLTIDGGVTADGGPLDGGTPSDGGLVNDGGVGGTGVSIRFRVATPVGTPAFEPVHVAGNQAALGAWSGRGLALARVGVNLYEGAWRFPVGTQLEFKLTRGDWERVEKDAQGGEVPNRTHTVNAPVTLALTVAAWRDAPSVTGLVEDLGVVTSAFVTPRPVLVWLPPDYSANPTRRYPVLYFHDGQNLFDERTSFQGVEWGVDEAMESLVASRAVEPVIVVAVGNAAQRIADYTPVADPDYGGGQADAYARFLVEELKPRIDGRYRTELSAARTGVAGSSLGGLVSAYLGLTRANVFGRLGIVSPSVWWADRDLLARVRALPAKLPLRVWIDIGTAEGSGESVADAAALRDEYIAKGWVLGQDLSYRAYAGAAHNEASWAARVGDVLRYLYPAPGGP